MAGMSFSERQDNRKKHLDAVNRYLARFPWQRVLVLTIARGSRNDFVHETYPLFLSILRQHLGVPLQDFWDTEHGDLFGQLHMNVLLMADATIPPDLINGAWKLLVGSRIWNMEYDPEKGPGYWIKNLGSLQANEDYGGSVIDGTDFPLPDRPRRTTKSDHNRERPRRRFRPQTGLFRQPPSLTGLHSRRGRIWQATADELELARRIREQQGVA